jgi:hypothetical protein
MYNVAIMKAVVTIVFTGILNILCARGLGIVSWLLVFIPFITMTLVTAILLYVFGLSPITGKLDYSVYTPNSQQQPLDAREQAAQTRFNVGTWSSLQSMPSTTNMQKTSSTTLSSTPESAMKPDPDVLAMEKLYKLGQSSTAPASPSDKVNVYSEISN